MNSADIQNLSSIHDQIIAYSRYVHSINDNGYLGAAELGETIAERLSALIEDIIERTE
jgi:hypothetical protein